jgi:hypothetical protein
MSWRNFNNVGVFKSKQSQQVSKGDENIKNLISGEQIEETSQEKNPHDLN